MQDNCSRFLVECYFFLGKRNKRNNFFSEIDAQLSNYVNDANETYHSTMEPNCLMELHLYFRNKNLYDSNISQPNFPIFLQVSNKVWFKSLTPQVRIFLS